MNVLVAGGHGKIGLRLLRLLAARGDTARGLIRNPGQAADLEEAGAEPVILSLEEASEEELAEVAVTRLRPASAERSGPRGSGREAEQPREFFVRPGLLTDDPGTGLIEVGTPLDRRGEVTRDDVAATLVAVLDEPGTIGLTFDLLGGDIPVADAVASLVPG